MHTGRENISVEELFRLKLENAEIVPTASSGSTLMRRLRYREFLRFNPLRFNVYYLGLILSALIAGGILLFSENRNNNNDPAIQNQVPGELLIPRGYKIFADPEVSEAKDVISLPSQSSVDPGKYPDLNGITKNIDTTRHETVAGSTTNNIIINSFSSTGNSLIERSHSQSPIFTPSVSEGCVPLSVSFNVNSTYESWIWKFGEEGFSDKQDPVWVFKREGIYDVILNAELNGKIHTWSTKIKVHPKPQASFALSPEKPVLPDDEVYFVNYSTDAASYIWDFGDGSGSTQFEPRHRYEEFENYSVMLLARSNHGCIDTALLSNAFAGHQFYIDMPNAFIPNPFGPSGGFYSYMSDESGEIFHPMFSGVDEYNLIVYSKLGMVLFQTNDINIGWDGYYNGQLSNPGVYIWKISGKYRNGTSFNKMGDVTLLKK